jgi:hypothetical protein
MFANCNLFPNFDTAKGCCDLVVDLPGFGANVLVRDNVWFLTCPTGSQIVSVRNEI